MRLLWLADCLRAAGLEVREVDGWRARGEELPGLPAVVIGHHTATPLTTANRDEDIPTLDILVRGRSDLPGPLCQLGLGRSGTYYVVASGKANHAGRGRAAGVLTGRRTIGIEAEHPGTGSWPQEQLAAYDLGVAALLQELGRGADNYVGHREWALPPGRKVDPGGIELEEQRGRIARLLAGGGPLRGRTPADVDEEELDVDEKTLRKIIQDEVREEVRCLLGDLQGPDDRTHYALNDVRADLLKIKEKLGV